MKSWAYMHSHPTDANLVFEISGSSAVPSGWRKQRVHSSDRAQRPTGIGLQSRQFFATPAWRKPAAPMIAETRESLPSRL